MLDPITLVNRALARISVDPIQSFAEEFNGTSAGLVYDGVIGFCIGLYPWSWAQELRALPKLSVPSPFGYGAVYQLPSDRLGPPLRITNTGTFPQAAFSDYILSGDQAHADADPLFALIKFLPDPLRWSALFAEAGTLALAGEFAMTLADDEKLRAQYRQDAFGPPGDDFRGGVIGAAMREDARATPPRKLPSSNPFLAAHQS